MGSRTVISTCTGRLVLREALNLLSSGGRILLGIDEAGAFHLQQKGTFMDSAPETPLAVGGDWTEVVGQDQQPKLRRASLVAGAIKIEIKKPGAEELESLMFYERVDAETVHTRFVRADTGTTFVVVNKVCK